MELLLARLNRLEISAGRGDPESLKQYGQATEELNEFMAEHEPDLDCDTIYQLLRSHGRMQDAFLFATRKVPHFSCHIH